MYVHIRVRTVFLICRVECGGEFSVLVSGTGILMMCGCGDHGVQGHGDRTDCLKPKLVEELLSQDVIQVKLVYSLFTMKGYRNVDFFNCLLCYLDLRSLVLFLSFSWDEHYDYDVIIEQKTCHYS